MRPDEFQMQMNRLITQFGKGQYSDERTKLIWREVKDFTNGWWEKTVDQLLLSCRQAPLSQEIGEHVAKERERIWQIEKKKNSKEAKEFFNSSYGPEDTRTVCQTIIKRLQGSMGDKDYDSFKSMIKNVAETNPNTAKVECRSCEDSGIIWTRNEDNYQFINRCRCQAGMRQPRSYPVYQQ